MIRMSQASRHLAPACDCKRGPTAAEPIVRKRLNGVYICAYDDNTEARILLRRIIYLDPIQLLKKGGEKTSDA